ncbi:hypothetical protein ABW19_dt0209286 [Dactylella cylindrospora]|nr:hypothetical protein ABW19_dt0209286 [Dactylella cylindrospora]
MSRYIPPTAPIPTTLHSTIPISHSHAHTLLSQYLLATTSSQPWSHSHDAGTTSSLKKIELSLRGIHGPEANTHLAMHLDDDGVSKVDTDEGGEMERRRVYETVEGEEGEGSEDDGLKELQDVKHAEEGEEGGDAEGGNEGETTVIDKEERKRLKKLRHKEEKRRKEAERLVEKE